MGWGGGSHQERSYVESKETLLSITTNYTDIIFFWIYYVYFYRINLI